MTGRWMIALALGVCALDAPAVLAEQANTAVVFRWKTMTGAVAYQVQIAEDRGFRSIVVDERTYDTRFEWKTLGTRTYYWRVRAIDDSGKAGTYSKPRRLEAVVGPPTLLSPASGKRLSRATGGEATVVRLSWSGGSLIRTYVVEVSRSADFAQTLFRETTVDTNVPFKAQTTGTYYWRVSATDVNGQPVGASKPRSFSIVTPAPDGLRSRSTIPWKRGLSVLLRWGELESGGYEVEVTGPGGRTRRSTASARLAFSPTGPGRYRWRVRGTDPLSSWSRSRSLHIALASPTGIETEVRPADAAGASRLELTWQASEGATKYRVSIASAGRSEVSEAEDPRFGTMLPPGTYQVRVTALAESIESEPSAVVSVEVGGEARVAVHPPPTSTRKSRLDRLWLAPRLGFLHNLGDLSAATVGVGVEARVPRVARLRPYAMLSYFTDSTATGDPQGMASARIHGLITRVGAAYRHPIGPVVVRVAGGLSAVWLRASVTGDASGSVSAGRLGGFVTVGVEKLLGPGSLFFDLEWSEVAAVDELVRVDADGPAVAAGYRIAVF